MTFGFENPLVGQLYTGFVYQLLQPFGRAEENPQPLDGELVHLFGRIYCRGTYRGIKGAKAVELHHIAVGQVPPYALLQGPYVHKHIGGRGLSRSI